MGMMTNRALGFASVLVALFATSGRAAPIAPETLTASSAWNVNYADDYCRLARAFGTGDAMTFLVMDRFAPGQAFKLTLAGKRFNTVSDAAVLKMRFGPDEKEQTPGFFKGDLGKGRPALVVRGDLRLDGPNDRELARYKSMDGELPEKLSVERISAVNELVVSKPLRTPMRLALGSMKAPFAALDKCMDELLVRWGVDVARHTTLFRRVVPVESPANWLKNSDYPESARFKGAQGIVNFRLSIDDVGKATACHIQQSTRPPEFDTAVCKALMRRARFKPALDKDEKPLASYYRGTVVFSMS